MKKILSVALTSLLATSMLLPNANAENLNPEPVFDHVLDAGTFTELDYENAERVFAGAMQIEGGCSAIAKTLDNGDTIVGRNMDLNFSHKPAYIVRTHVDGGFETVGVSYVPFMGADYEEVMKNGIDEEQMKLIPFECTDVMNSEGLYVEINMRSGEYDEDGNSVFGCTGTNPGAEHRVCSIVLCRYIAEHCASVSEVKDYLDTLDIYTPNTVGMDWNFCFLVADKTGKTALIEIACNKISFLEDYSAQCNFYRTEEFAKKEHKKAGVGRYTLLNDGIDDVQSEDDMFKLMDKVSYFSMYSPDTCEFDYRTELVGLNPGWTDEYVQDEANRKEVENYARETGERVQAKSLEQLQDDGTSWESVFTEIANCNSRTLTVRFFEDDEKMITLGF